MKNRKIKVVVTNVTEFLSVSNPINSIYKSCFKCLSELEDEVIAKYNLGVPIDFIKGQSVGVEYKEDGFYIFEFIRHHVDDFKVLNYYFKFRV